MFVYDFPDAYFLKWDQDNYVKTFEYYQLILEYFRSK